MAKIQLLFVVALCIFPAVSSRRNLLPNSCLDRVVDSEDVLLQLIDSAEYPAINAACSNEYVIVDISKDNNWYKYLSSNRLYHYAVTGPVKDDHSNTAEWLLPDFTDFLVSPDCATCDEKHELNSEYGTKSSYYMTPEFAGCSQLPAARIGCDMHYWSYECNTCETKATRFDGYWTTHPIYNGVSKRAAHITDELAAIPTWGKYGSCAFTIRDAESFHNETTDTLDHCKTATNLDVGTEQILPRRRPSLGTDGRFCLCAKPKELKMYETTAMKDAEMPDTMIQEEDIQKEHNEVIYLYQKDFVKGTFRIRKSGTYIIEEDIVFDFSAPEGYKTGELESYNGPTAWWPDEKDSDQYPGAGGVQDSYVFGFWAGITIETNDVILDLNGHTLQQSKAFYYQQPFFTHISLASQIFLPGQGPAFFGATPIFAQNVIIRNGELGLSSHFGIQGNFNKHIMVENLKIHSFKTHGIQFNGFTNIEIKNVDIGHNVMTDLLSPYYAHMKALLPIYRKMKQGDPGDTTKDELFYFAGRDEGITFNQLIDEINLLLDLSFKYVMFDYDPFKDETLSENEEKLWDENKDVLLNTYNDNKPQTATLYGIFLNYVGSNVVGWYAGSPNVLSRGVKLENVNVHDLEHNTKELITFNLNTNCLNAPMNAYHVWDEEQVEQIGIQCSQSEEKMSEGCRSTCNSITYTGNKIVDIQIIAWKLMNDFGFSWNYCPAGGFTFNSLSEHALEDSKFSSLHLVGTRDPMVHPGKGVMGIRFNGVTDVELQNVNVYNIHSSTALGSDLMGYYTNQPLQQKPYQIGFSMNMVKGISLTFTKNVVVDDVKINNIESETGLSYGLSAWFDSTINVENNGLEVNNIFAGTKLNKDLTKYHAESYPFLAPEACAIRVYDDENFQVEVNYNNNIKVKCVDGHLGCLWIQDEYTLFGEYKDCENHDQQIDEKLFYFNSNFVANYSSTLQIVVIIFVGCIMFLFWYSKKIQKSMHSASKVKYSKIPQGNAGYGSI